MTEKIKEFPSGASVYMSEPSFPTGMIGVVLRSPDGEVYDKVRCDTRKGAKEYFRAFCEIAKNKWRK